MADRRKMGTKDMAWTMAVVLVVVALIALYGSQVSFSPGTQPSTGDAPTVDVIGGFSHAKGVMDFPVTVPADVPDDWHPNSFTVSDPTLDGPGAVPTVRGGWITPDDGFIMLVESAADPERLLDQEFDSVGSATGTADAGGARWTVTTGRRGETVWFRTSGSGTLLITGSASPHAFSTLAEAVAAAP